MYYSFLFYSGTLPPQPNGSLRSHGHVLRHMSGRRANMNRRGSTTKRNSKDGVRPLLNSLRNHPGPSIQQKHKDEGETIVPSPKGDIQPKDKTDQDPPVFKNKEHTTTPPKLSPKTKTGTLSLDANHPRKLSLSHSDSSLATLGRPVSATNLNWFKPVITGSLEFSKTSLCLPSQMRDEMEKSSGSNSSEKRRMNESLNMCKGKLVVLTFILDLVQ